MAVSRKYATNKQLLENTLVEANKWSGRHTSKFAADKFELILFRNTRAPDPEPDEPDEPPEVDIWECYEWEGHDRLPVVVPPHPPNQGVAPITIPPTE